MSVWGFDKPKAVTNPVATVATRCSQWRYKWRGVTFQHHNGGQIRMPTEPGRRTPSPPPLLGRAPSRQAKVFSRSPIALWKATENPRREGEK